MTEDRPTQAIQGVPVPAALYVTRDNVTLTMAFPPTLSACCSWRTTGMSG